MKKNCNFRHFYMLRNLRTFFTPENWLADKTKLFPCLYKWSLYEVIEDILPFVLNTKEPLSDTWLLRFKQNSFA